MDVLMFMLMPPGPCAHVISQSFKQRVDPEGYDWTQVSKEMRELYWEEFQKKCCWDETIDSLVRKAWARKVTQSYRQYLFNMRSPKRKKHGFKPAHISQEVWNSCQLKWNTEEYKLKSKQNKKNRRNSVADGVAKPTHNAGTACHLKIAFDFKRKLGHEPPHSELFLYTHTKNHVKVTFTNEKDRQIHAAYIEKREELEAKGVEFEEDKLFYAVVGGHDKKRRLYGLGSFAKKKRGNLLLKKQQNEELKEMMNAQQEENKARIGHLEKQLQTTLDLINVVTKQQE
ncbi:uncharacterized protein LOC111878594 [Lactuca sativa]|uniref:uncharacterized protein LOC111878594 n=1 Tax=Lactuca sativa TaxID=4236 RepID=UPI0022AFA5DE|nr:uncharacterized protein LOC111878594 [Lactuca sativa]